MIYVSIGNSDDKLEQRRWAMFVREVDRAIQQAAAQVHGQWFSAPNAEFQNACWGFELREPQDDRRQGLRVVLALIARQFNQDSIAWADATVSMVLAAGPAMQAWNPEPYMEVRDGAV